MAFKLEIETGNDAFQDGNQEEEIARILEDTAQRIRGFVGEGKLRDFNGNTVGSFELTEDE